MQKTKNERAVQKLQKRILCIHDLASIGKCSLSVIIPVLNVLGHETCALPTAVLSSHTGGFGTPASQELTLHCVNSLAHYSILNISFDCVYSGYVANQAQLALIHSVLSHNKGIFFVLDPVMGDNGKMYNALPAALPAAMKDCAQYADILTPNETESALLLGLDPFIQISTRQEAENRLLLLSKICGGDVVITGLCVDNNYFNGVRSRSGEIKFIQYTKKGQPYPGTGDIFTAVLCGRSLLGDNIFSAVQKAADFVADCVAQAEADGKPSEYGVPFEKLLKTLV